MKNYHSYMERQHISPEGHQKLLELERKPAPEKRNKARNWMRYGALAACCALVLGLGLWKLAPGQKGSAVLPASSSGTQGASGQPTLDGTGFTVEGSGGEKLMLPMIPYINYQDLTGAGGMAASIALPEGSFQVDLTQEDIQTIFWGPGGEPEAENPKNDPGDLPWMLCWDGYTLRGHVIYDGTGRLFWLTIFGEHPDGPEFQLELSLDHLPPTCLVGPGRETTTVFETEVTGWRMTYDRNGDGVTDHICGSEFMAGDVGVRFESVGAPFRVDPGDGWDETEAACRFNALFVRQTLASDGGLYLDHLKENGHVPAWRAEGFSTLAQARQEGEFAPYLPTKNLSGYGEFCGRLTYQEGHENTLFVRWSRGYDDVEVCVHRPEGEPWWGDTVDVSDQAGYDTRLYSIPWCDSVPEKYRDNFYCPDFRVEDMTLDVVKARVTEKDTGGTSFHFGVLHPDGTLVRYSCDGLTAEQVWALVEDTLD